ncbi:MAG: hypothetical protein DMG65_18860 [Candidatus Angelobacter sp. Gp1-AA117]|nr:MAG: hypothetical protein DMG65_18860 [Candidatus Angelobacter sp. Gp1-AA117]
MPSYFQSKLLGFSLLLTSVCLAQNSGSSPVPPPDAATIVRSALEKFQARSTEARNYLIPPVLERASVPVSSEIHLEQEVLYSDFKKFHADTRIVPSSDQ